MLRVALQKSPFSPNFQVDIVFECRQRLEMEQQRFGKHTRCSEKEGSSPDVVGRVTRACWRAGLYLCTGNLLKGRRPGTVYVTAFSAARKRVVNS